jgi:hypothetical protein
VRRDVGKWTIVLKAIDPFNPFGRNAVACLRAVCGSGWTSSGVARRAIWWAKTRPSFCGLDERRRFPRSTHLLIHTRYEPNAEKLLCHFEAPRVGDALVLSSSPNGRAVSSSSSTALELCASALRRNSTTLEHCKFSSFSVLVDIVNAIALPCSRRRFSPRSRLRAVVRRFGTMGLAKMAPISQPTIGGR